MLQQRLGDIIHDGIAEGLSLLVVVVTMHHVKDNDLRYRRTYGATRLAPLTVTCFFRCRPKTRRN